MTQALYAHINNKTIKKEKCNINDTTGALIITLNDQQELFFSLHF
jgi:hypothetical protein